MPKRLCVYCASADAAHFEPHAERFVQAAVQAGIEIVYGGANIGMMRVVADSALAAGGTVIGVMPKTLAERELAHPGLTVLHKVETLAERKAMMINLASGFVALPGGFGTLDEIFDTVTRTQIGEIDKPIWLYDVDGYYQKLAHFLDHAVQVGMLREHYRSLVRLTREPADVFASLKPLPLSEVA